MARVSTSTLVILPCCYCCLLLAGEPQAYNTVPFRGLTVTHTDDTPSVQASRLSLSSALKLTPEKGSQLSARLSRAGTGPLSAHGGAVIWTTPGIAGCQGPAELLWGEVSAA